MYVKGGFKVGLVSGKYVWGLLERLDIIPTTLTVSLSSNKLWPANEKLVPITATITVKDDFDPQPEIKLESITANETLDMDDAKNVEPGTDGSGNKATASAIVTVPHDEREHEGRDREVKSR